VTGSGVKPNESRALDHEVRMLYIDSAPFERACCTLGGVQSLVQNVHDRGKACRSQDRRA